MTRKELINSVRSARRKLTEIESEIEDVIPDVPRGVFEVIGNLYDLLQRARIGVEEITVESLERVLRPLGERSARELVSKE